MPRYWGVLWAGMLISFAVAPSAAQGAVRNAVAQGGATTGDCIATPCTFPRALTAAVADDEVLVQPGDYALPPFSVNKRLYIHGVEGQPRPRIVDSAGGVGRYMTLDAMGIRLRHLYIESSNTNVTLASNNSVTLERLEVVKNGGNTAAAVLLELGSPLLRDSIVRSASGSALVLQATDNAQLSNVTAYAPATNSGTAIAVSAYDYSNGITPCDPSRASSATARNVIARGGLRDILVSSTCGKSASLNIRNSNYRPGSVVLSGGAMATLNAAGGNQSADPLFAGAATGDLHLLPGSPAIDAGIADPMNGTADLDGDARPQGAAIDIGADEFVPPAPPADGGGGDSGGVDGGGGGGDGTVEPPSNQFSFGKLKRNKRLGTANLTVQVPGPGRLALAKTRKLRADAESAAAGAEKLSIVPKARVIEKLERRGKATVNVSVTYVPDGGEPNTVAKKFKLVKR